MASQFKLLTSLKTVTVDVVFWQQTLDLTWTTPTARIVVQRM